MVGSVAFRKNRFRNEFAKKQACAIFSRAFNRCPHGNDPDSSALELSTVNRAAVGSNPTQGATFSRRKAGLLPKTKRPAPSHNDNIITRILRHSRSCPARMSRRESGPPSSPHTPRGGRHERVGA